MISPGLLNSVLNLSTEIDKVKYIENNMVIYGSWTLSEFGWYDEINIFELAYKCKEWAKRNGRFIEIKTCKYGYRVYVWEERYTESPLVIINGDYEPDAIFEACEWILKENK